MESYGGQGGPVAGRRAGIPGAPQQGPPGAYPQQGYPPQGSSGDGGPRFGRRASPGDIPQPGAFPAAASMIPGGAPVNRQAGGLAQLKQAQAARITARVPSPSTGQGYVPSAAAPQQPRPNVIPAAQPGTRPMPVPGAPGAMPMQRPQGIPGAPGAQQGMRPAAQPGQPGPRPMMPVAGQPGVAAPRPGMPPGQPGMMPNGAPGVRGPMPGGPLPGGAPGLRPPMQGMPQQAPGQPRPMPMGAPAPQPMMQQQRPPMQAGQQLQQRAMGGPIPVPGSQQPPLRAPPPQQPPQQVMQQQRMQPPSQAAYPPGGAPQPRPGAPPGGPPGAPVPVNLAAAASANRSAALAALANRRAAASPAQPGQQGAPMQQPMMQQRGPPPPQQAMQRPAPQQAPPQQRPPPMQAQQQRPPQQQFGRSMSWEDQPVSPARGFGAIPPGAEQASTGPLIQCRTCGRSFNQQALAKHAKVCEKVFVKKRKQFNVVEARVAGTELAKYVDTRRGVPKSDLTGRNQKQQAGGKMSKWKAQSEQLRAAMRANRQIAEAQARGEDIRHMKFDTGPEVPDDRVECPYCGRKFAQLTADRHIPHCKNTQAKPNFLKAGARTGNPLRR